MDKDERPATKPKLDVLGAVLLGAALFLLVLGLSEGGRYGWFKPREDLVLADRTVWPASAPISFVPLLFLLSALLMFSFYLVERRREAARRDPLFEFSLLEHKGYRYGLITTVVLAMGQLSFIFVIPLVLQQGQQLSAARIGWWLLPTGVSIAIGAQVGGRSTRRVGPTTVVLVGLLLEAVGLTYVALALIPDVHFLRLLPGFIGYGFGIGLATSQLTSVVLHSIPHHRAGVASGASSTLGQLGGALGVAITASILSVQTIRATIEQLNTAPLSAPVQAQAIEQVTAAGVGYVPPAHLPASTTETLEAAFQHGLVTGAKPAMLFGTVVVVIGALLSLLIPRMPALGRRPPVREVVPAETPVSETPVAETPA